MKACIDCGLLSRAGYHFALTEQGKELARCQNEVSTILSPAAKDFILKRVYLNLATPGENCCDFVLQLKVDTIRGTFVYLRTDKDSDQIVKWMQLLNCVGFLDVYPDVAVVRQEHLGLMNSVLAKLRLRAPIADEEGGSELNEIGNLAEEKAVEDEKMRLRSVGYEELVCLVQRISQIDKTAGYDIVSCQGIGALPEEQIFIEVKGTRKPDISFVWSQNERSVANQKRKAYWLYIYTNINLSARSTNGPLRINDPAYELVKLGYIQEPLDVYVSKSRV